MDTKDKADQKSGTARDPAAEMDAAVKKAEAAEKRLRGAEDGPLETLGAADDFVERNPDQPGATAGGPG